MLSKRKQLFKSFVEHSLLPNHTKIGIPFREILTRESVLGFLHIFIVEALKRYVKHNVFFRIKRVNFLAGPVVLVIEKTIYITDLSVMFIPKSVPLQIPPTAILVSYKHLNILPERRMTKGFICLMPFGLTAVNQSLCNR